MNDPVSGLLGIVREEISLYQDLVEHAQRKTALLVQADAAAVEDSNRADEGHSFRLRRLESEMRQVCRDLGCAYRIPPEEFSLERLAARAEPALALEIRSQSALLRNLARQLKSALEHNKRFVEKSLCYSRGLLALLGNASGSYQQSGLFEKVPPIRPAFSKRA